MAESDITKKAVLSLLQSGVVASYAEAAQMAGTSRQLVRHWARGMPPPPRAEYLEEQFRKALRRAERSS